MTTAPLPPSSDRRRGAAQARRRGLRADVLVLVGRKVARGLRLVAQPLHGIHHVVGLRQERIAQALHPGRILAERRERLRECHQRLHARIPRLRSATCFDRVVALGIRIRLRPGRRIGDIARIGRRHQHLRQQRIGIQRDRRDQEALVHAVEDGRIPYKRLEDALTRHRRAKEGFLAAAVTPGARNLRHIIGCDEHRRVADEMARFA